MNKKSVAIPEVLERQVLELFRAVRRLATDAIQIAKLARNLRADLSQEHFATQLAVKEEVERAADSVSTMLKAVVNNLWDDANAAMPESMEMEKAMSLVTGQRDKFNLPLLKEDINAGIESLKQGSFSAEEVREKLGLLKTVDEDQNDEQST